MCEKKGAPKFDFLFFGILIFGIVPAKTAFAGALWAPHPPSCFVLAQQGSPAGSGAAGPLAFCPKAQNIPYAPRKQVCPLVGISKHWGANSTLLADTQKPQPQLGQNVQALRPALRQTLQPRGLGGPPGRPRPKVAISVKVQASELGQIVPALAMASE